MRPPPFTTRPVIAGRRGVVAAGHYLAAEAGMRVLNAGGNAVDAGVAAGFVLSLVLPHQNGIGGEAPILVRQASTGRVAAINGQGTAPGAATIDWFRARGMARIPGDGLLGATVPAAFGAWVTALEQFGTLNLEATLAPAVELARDGFATFPYLHVAVEMCAERFRAEWPASAAIYLDDGRVPRVGRWVTNPAWASTFGAVIREAASARSREAGLRAARDYFYRGPIAARIAEFSQAHGGLLDADDLAGFATRIEDALTVRYHGVDVHKCGPWSQGPVFAQQLLILDGFDLARLGHNSVEYIHTVVEAAKLAFADRERHYADPQSVEVPLEWLLSPDHADELRKRIDSEHAATAVDFPPPDPDVSGAGDAARDTTHVDVIDAAGNMISATPSGGWITSSPVIEEVGFPLGTRAQMFSLRPDHPNRLEPGKRPRTTLSPSLATVEGRPHAAFGTPGGDQQDQWSLQFLLNAIHFGMDLQAAIDAPTFHTTHFPSSFDPHEVEANRVYLEPRIGERVAAELRTLGHDVRFSEDWTHGVVSAVRIDPKTGLIEGAASPRSMTAYAIGR